MAPRTRSRRTTSSRLLALPDSLLGVIFEALEPEDRRAYMHTCKHLHNNQECLSKIRSVVLFLDKEHGTIHRQLSTVIPGSAITQMVVCGCKRTATCVDQRIAFRSPAALPLVTAFSRNEHQQLLQGISQLEVDEMCAIKDAPNISALVGCLRECLPNMKHLTVGSVAVDNITFLLSELPQLQLASLKLGIAADDLSEPGTGLLSPSACGLLGQLHTLQHLTIDCDVFEGNLAPFASLSSLKSLRFIAGWEDNEGNCFANTVGLNALLAGVPLTDLALPCLPETPVSQSLRRLSLGICSIIDLPMHATLPSLMHLESTYLKHDPGKSHTQFVDTMNGLTNISLDCKDFWLVSDAKRGSCAGFLHVLTSRGIVFERVDNLVCSNINFRPGELSQLAAVFPNVEGFKLEECCFGPSGILTELCDFCRLQVCSIDDLDEWFDLEDMEDCPEEYSFGSFIDGLKEACAAVQARRNSSLPPLHIKLINMTDTTDREAIYEAIDHVSVMLFDSVEPPEAPKIVLHFVHPWYGYSTTY